MGAYQAPFFYLYILLKNFEIIMNLKRSPLDLLF